MECVPNISEGRRPEVIAALRAAAASGGCCVLDVHSDADHNRAVLTLAGAPGVVEESVLRLAAAAVALVDMRRHHGAHPRIGALDVVPIVPLAGCAMAACTALAERIGRRLGTEHGIPVYLYGNAARPGRPHRLADLRRDGFEGLVAGGTLALAPDFGPPSAGAGSGACAVGSRDVLVAFNLLLDTPDVGTAQRVARAVRESSGGLPGVQALGLFLPGRDRAQVSTNVLDHARTPLLRLIKEVRSAAAAAGAAVTEVELVGLAPAAALAGLDEVDLPGVPPPGRSIEAHLALCG